MDLEVLHLLCHEQESSLRPLQRNRHSQGEKPVLHAGKQKEGKLSISYMACRTCSSGKQREAFRYVHLIGTVKIAEKRSKCNSLSAL